MTTPVPSMERVKAVYELRKDSARPDHREVASFLAHYLALRAALDVRSLEAGALCLEIEALRHRHPLMSDWATKTDTKDALRAGEKASNEKLGHAAALRHLIQIQEGA